MQDQGDITERHIFLDEGASSNDSEHCATVGFVGKRATLLFMCAKLNFMLEDDFTWFSKGAAETGRAKGRGQKNSTAGMYLCVVWS